MRTVIKFYPELDDFTMTKLADDARDEFERVNNINSDDYTMAGLEITVKTKFIKDI